MGETMSDTYDVILAEHDAEGRVRVTQTGDRLGRRGLGWGGGVGLTVGLFAPPLLAAVAVGGAVGGYAGMDIGRDNGLVADLAYEDKAPYAFTGTVKKVVFGLKPATREDERALHEHAQAQAIGEGAAG